MLCILTVHIRLYIYLGLEFLIRGLINQIIPFLLKLKSYVMTGLTFGRQWAYLYDVFGKFTFSKSESFIDIHCVRALAVQVHLLSVLQADQPMPVL